jgi:hypothetical protein
MRNYWLFIIATILAGTAIPLNATSVRRLSFEELVQTSNAIVEGSVVDAHTYRSGDGKLILTSYTINVQENLKGSSGSTLTVTTVGGRIGNTILHVAGMPVFQPGERAVLFLEKAGAYTTIVGLNQGKFAISNGAVSNSSDGLSFPDGGPGRSLKMPLEEFKRQIKLHNNR